MDKVEVESDLVTSDGKITTREFDGLSHGLHTLEVYATANIYGSIVESNRLKYDIIVKETGKVTPIISINYNVEEVIQGETFIRPKK